MMTDEPSADSPKPRGSPVRALLNPVVFGAGILLCCEAGHLLSFSQLPFATFWPASGLSIAVLAMASGAAWPRLIVAAFAANLVSNLLIHDQPLHLSVAFCVAHIVEALIGAVLLVRLRQLMPGPSEFHQLLALAIAGTVAAACGATIGLTAMSAANGEGFDLNLWKIWLGADLVGLLFVGPAVLNWSSMAAATNRRWTWWRIAEAAAMLAGLCTFAFLIGAVQQITVRSLPFRAFPFLVWSAARFGVRGTSLSLLIFFAILVELTVRGRGPFAAGAELVETRIMALQLCASIFGLTFLLLAAVIDDRDRAIFEATQSRAAAESANAAKSRFLANMSHELRTPIGGMVAMTNLVLDSDLKSQQREQLILVNRSADSLLALVNDILDVAKAEAGKLALRPGVFSLQQCLNDLLTLLQAQAERRQISVSCRIAGDVPDLLLADKGRLRQVLLNLLGNAVKFTRAGSIGVEVEVESADAANCVLQFCVSDTGIGISPAMQARLFRPFEQGVSSEEYGGTGLGLAIVQQLVGLMGGRIGVESEPGRGSRFHFTVPAAIPATIPSPALDESTRQRPVPTAAPVAHPLGSGPSVLVVEDDVVNATYLRMILEKAGFRVSVAGNGAEAVELWQPTAFDFVLTDLRMPVMNGVDLTRRIRSLEGSGPRRIPIIAVTAGDDPDEREACLRAGADHCLTKPFAATDLFHVLQDVLARCDERVHRDL